MDGMLKVGLVCATGSLICFVLAGDGGLMAIWFGVALLVAPMIVIKLRRDVAPAEAPAAGSRHRQYVFASETTSAPKRSRKVVP